ncbi:hypothetical protein SAMN04487783_0621 [Agrococcus baldri]|uniref:DUF5671 domain-containing protein n=1 Tax=Agrococcus baldri TaxID=153730 RepID=A0AA94HLM1_9MICO|nr:DUF5671 domain-containing protein [Agrococcus baldri]SFS02089.1 hypothetical protein SAMN04487783_0621 [Agrococcus baldri]
MSAVQAPVAPAPRSAQGTVRRLIVYSILFVLVVIAATGISGLIGRLLETRPQFAEGAGGLALSLAFSLIAGPLAVVLWWFLWRRLDGPDRSSVAWGLYLSAIAVVSLVTFTTALLGTAADLVRGTWSPEALATGISWLVVWVLHRMMWGNDRKGPLRLTAVPLVLGAAYGLVVAVTGAVRTLEPVFGEALLPADAQIGSRWWSSALQALVWAVGGAAIWWWHWVRERARMLRDGFAAVVLVIVGVLGAAAVTLGGLGASLFVALRAAFDRSDPWPVLLDPLPLAVAAASVGGIVWLYHGRIAQQRSDAVRSAARLVEAGIGLIAAASGIGVVVNALLASLTAPLAGDDARTLLLGGIAAIVVGAPIWWVAWQPLRVAADAGTTGRRVYLVAVFGVSAVVAIVALLVVGYRIFEFVLDGGGGGLIERIRAPFGLLLATALVAAYHFAIWRRDRGTAPPSARARMIDRVILVSAGEAGALAEAIESATGASVTRWTRAGDEAAAAAAPATVVEALAGVTGRRVLVVAGPGDRVEVIPLAE